jgi:hypothetical protein
MKQKTGEKTAPTQSELEAKASETILSKPLKFSVAGLGDFEVGKIPLGVWIMVSDEARKIEHQAGGNALNTIASAKVNAEPACMVIAMAVLWNSDNKVIPAKIKEGRRLFGVKVGRDKVIQKEYVITTESQIKRLAEQFLWSLDSADIYSLILAIYNRMNPDFFFNCTNLLSGIKMMTPAT